MKKLFAIMLMLMYGFSSTGMTISLHYCCGKLKSIDWTVPKQKTCDHQKKMGGKPCCETKLISKKDKSDQEFSGIVFKLLSTELAEPKTFAEAKHFEFNNRQLIPEVFAPLPLPSLRLYISYRVFRI